MEISAAIRASFRVHNPRYEQGVSSNGMEKFNTNERSYFRITIILNKRRR